MSEKLRMLSEINLSPDQLEEVAVNAGFTPLEAHSRRVLSELMMYAQSEELSSMPNGRKLIDLCIDMQDTLNSIKVNRDLTSAVLNKFHPDCQNSRCAC